MLDILRRIMQKFADIYDPLESMRMMVKEVRNAVGSDLCAVYIVDQANNQYILLASEGFKPGVDGKLTIKKNEGIVGWVGERGEPINLENASSNPHFKYFPETGEEIYNAFLGVPIIHQRELLGVIVVQQKSKRKFDESEEAFLVTVAAQLGGVIAHGRLTGMLINPAPAAKTAKISSKIIQGLSSATGVVIGKAVLAYIPADLNSVPERKILDTDAEIILFQQALDVTKTEIKKLAENLASQLPPEDLVLFDAYSHILNDSTLSNEIIAEIKLGQWAQGAVKKILKRHISLFDHIDDLYIRERAADLKDLGQRILSNLQKKDIEHKKFPDQAILVGKELTAAALAEIPSNKLVGIVSIEGTPNSHIAIVAKALNLPTIMGAKKLDLNDIEGKELFIDAYNGQVYIEPDQPTRKKLLKFIAEEQELFTELASLQDKKAQTLDGHAIKLFVNTGMVSDFFSSAAHPGADGIGLYRTEVPFMIRDRFPSEHEQKLLYKKTLENYHPLPVIMRTLDIGGDKNLPYFPFEENNPFLGWRGIRITLDHPEIFLVQIRAMLSASCNFNNLAIMLPMVTNLNELIEAKKLITQAYNELIEEGLILRMPKIGIMVEVPAVVYSIEHFLEHVDFISVGTNDLIQYLLAVDRNNTRVADLYDPFHPAVLKALYHIATAAKKAKVRSSVCGEIAADPMAVILLLAMGYDSLSMNYSNIAKIKWVIRNSNFSFSKQVLDEILMLPDSEKIRTRLKIVIEETGVGELLRGGREL